MTPLDEAIYLARIELLDPVCRLPARQLEILLRRADVVTCGAGLTLTENGRRTDRLHYLLSGRVLMLLADQRVRSIRSDQDEALRPIDGPGARGATIRAVSDCTLLSVPAAELDALVRAAEQAGGAAATEVTEDSSAHWMTRMLKSGVFAHLPAGNIQQLFAALEPVPFRAGEAIVRQGEIGAYYYVVESGRLEVVRELQGGRSSIVLAQIQPGTGFGEEALISGLPRNATVRGLDDGCVMRLNKVDFLALVQEPLMQRLDPADALARVAHGGIWLDVRPGSAHARAGVAGAINLPIELLRIKHRELDRGCYYVVCADSGPAAAVAAFLLAERGFEVGHLDGRVEDVLTAMGTAAGNEPRPARDNVLSFSRFNRLPAAASRRAGHTDSEVHTMEPTGTPDEARPAQGLNAEPGGERLDSEQRVPRELLDATLTGRTLASLIEEIDSQRRTIAARPEDDDGAAAHADLDPLERTQAVRRVVEAALGDDAVHAPIGSGTVAVAEPAPAGTDDELTRLLRDLESRLRQQIERRVHERVAAELTGRTARIKDAAVTEIRRQAGVFKQRYEAAWRDKERQLAERERALQASYDRLMDVANRIGRQKAGINAQRQLLAEKLAAADSLHRQVTEIASTVGRQIDDLENLMAEAS
ncbi:MAG: cyclic nucleotide-binding domain-containing protein [Gammaproteobacteria bacterium]|nr:cyclic nucleotide-binding domain-containing protein [Gammaproteobacteria bacterium]